MLVEKGSYGLCEQRTLDQNAHAQFGPDLRDSQYNFYKVGLGGRTERIQTARKQKLVCIFAGRYVLRSVFRLSDLDVIYVRLVSLQ